jgi:hypothetical protein
MSNSIHPKRSKTTPRKNKGPWKAATLAERRRSAEERQAKRDKLTAQQQLAMLDKLGLTAARERARLQKQISSAATAMTSGSRPQGREVKNRVS